MGSVFDVTGWWTACPVTAALPAFGWSIVDWWNLKMTDYFAIRGDSKYSLFENAERVFEVLKSTSGLRQSGNCSFESASDKWLNITLVQADENGCFASDDKKLEVTNCLSIVASSHNRKYIMPILEHIAAELNWELIDDETETRLS